MNRRIISAKFLVNVLFLALLTFYTTAQQLGAPPLVQDIPLGEDSLDFLLGDLGIPPDYNDRQQPPAFPSGMPGPVADFFPSSFDWRSEGKISPVRNQLRCAACYAFAGTAVFEAMINIKFGDKIDIAEQQPISCDNRQAGCRGGLMGVFSFWETTSPHLENCNPFTGSDDASVGCASCPKNTYRVENWETVEPDDLFSIKNSIKSKGPGYHSFKVYYPFYNYWRGYDGDVYPHPSNPGVIRGGHACQVIGWDDTKEAWLLQNSWGLSPPGPLGDGSFYLPYNLTKQLNYGFAFISVRKEKDNEEGKLGSRPISCSNHVPCYETREAKDIHKDLSVRYLTGCYCKNSRCQIDFQQRGQTLSQDCIFCGTRCRDNKLYDLIR